MLTDCGKGVNLKAQAHIKNPQLSKKEEAIMCGVFGACLHPHGREISLRMANALRHRGQSATGVACFNTIDEDIDVAKGFGGVATALDRKKLDEMRGEFWIGHTRYPTQGTDTSRNQQPIWFGFGPGRVVVASNGDINMRQPADFLRERGLNLRTQNDAEVIAATIGYQLVYKQRSVVEAILKMMKHVQGAYSTLVMYERDPHLYAFRDPHGIRPFIYSHLTDFQGEYHLFASETCSIFAAYSYLKNQPNSESLQMEELREVEPGEIIAINSQGEKESFFYEGERSRNLCLMELFYFSRPDSWFDLENRVSFYTLRNRLGKAAFEQFGIKPEIFGPVPRSGNPFSMGYANAGAIRYEEFIIRNPELTRHVRNFIEPDRTAVAEKYRIIEDLVKGRHVGAGDDSIIQGLTSQTLARALRKVGAREIELFSSAPPCRFACHLGMHYKNARSLVAYGRDIDQISQRLRCNVHYLDLDRTYSTDGFVQGNHCDGCFTGNYPVDPE